METASGDRDRIIQEPQRYLGSLGPRFYVATGLGALTASMIIVRAYHRVSPQRTDGGEAARHCDPARLPITR